MKNIAFHNLYESLKNTEGVDMIENEIYIYESSEINTDGRIQPLKTDCSIVCICLKGELTGKIDLNEYHVKAPGIAISEPGQILEHAGYSNDFNGILIFMTRQFTDKFSMLTDHNLSLMIRKNPYINLGNEEVKSIVNYCNSIRKVIRSNNNPYRIQTIIHLTMAYFYGLGYFLHHSVKTTNKSKNEKITENFLQKVRENYKIERKVEFYAKKLQLSPNYLSHVIKDTTGKTAGEWIDDYVALEAKALIKSTNMTIQQIATELNFPTQSFFGKFFKRVVGVAPKYYK